ncbi:hypothetical protein PROFUN_16428 [Planoprotostelium fungivorum]|uniref:Uncharacterized protein n=1 Tax=Planoprotostelium fungivorum TaxID=1890364 RepID=A0A2P6MN24_9EUKA|nr:hypothetical protein PROFUN_16428 [Planoprotostelium fungivorum]
MQCDNCPYIPPDHPNLFCPAPSCPADPKPNQIPSARASGLAGLFLENFCFQNLHLQTALATIVVIQYVTALVMSLPSMFNKSVFLSNASQLTSTYFSSSLMESPNLYSPYFLLQRLQDLTGLQMTAKKIEGWLGCFSKIFGFRIRICKPHFATVVIQYVTALIMSLLLHVQQVSLPFKRVTANINLLWSLSHGESQSLFSIFFVAASPRPPQGSK